MIPTCQDIDASLAEKLAQEPSGRACSPDAPTAMSLPIGYCREAVRDVAVDRDRLLACLGHLENGVGASGLPGETLQSQSYHTTLPNGRHVHSTRTAFDYALALLAEGSVESIRKAHAVLRKVLPLQDRSPGSSTFGIWPWFFEEPLTEMNPPDWNWADFCGVRIAHILCRHADLLEAGLRDAATTALRDAAWSIFRRNVGPDYTNIAVKGGVITLVAGEYLNDPFLAAYGEERLQRFLEHTRERCGFGEYNSPTYGVLVLVEIERGLLLARNRTARQVMRSIHEEFWRQTAMSLHLPTGQLCGPHSRAYSDLLVASVSKTIGDGLGEPLFIPSNTTSTHDAEESIHTILVPRVPCPQAIRDRICQDSATGRERFVRTTFKHPAPATTGPSTDTGQAGAFWSHGDACIGSVDCENLWQQRHPVVGYWRIGDAVAVLRVRLRHAKHDFASGLLKTAQEGPALLSACTVITDRGDSHNHLDHPVDGVFRMSDLRLAVELEAPGAKVSIFHDGAGYALSAGAYYAEVRPVVSKFGGHRVSWDTACAENKVAVEARVDDGAEIALDPAAIKDVCLAVFVRLCPTGTTAEPVIVGENQDEHMIEASAVTPSTNLRVGVPRLPQKLGR